MCNLTGIWWKVTLAMAALACLACANINPATTTQCHVRNYSFTVTKPHKTEDGKLLYCWDRVIVKSCWGRCGSTEVGDYKKPYKLSDHPVCTYKSYRRRTVKLRHCHADHPNNRYQVIDATACSCETCESDFTSCENLNG